jgi:hypothetical protein
MTPTRIHEIADLFSDIIRLALAPDFLTASKQLVDQRIQALSKKSVSYISEHSAEYCRYSKKYALCMKMNQHFGVKDGAMLNYYIPQTVLQRNQNITRAPVEVITIDTFNVQLAISNYFTPV